MSDLDVFTRQYIGTSLQEKNGINSTFLGDDDGDNSTNATSESLASQSVNGLNDEESLSPDDECIDSPVEDRFTGDERHLIIYKNQYMQYQEKLCPQFVGRLNRGPKVPCYVVIRNNEEYLPTMEIEYSDKLILMWQAVDMDDFHIESGGLKVLVNVNIFTDSTFNLMLFSS